MSRVRAGSLALACTSTGVVAQPAPTLPRPEFPNPQFERAEWLNLNGTWQFAFDDADAAQAFVTKLDKAGIDGFRWTRNPAQIKIEKLPG